MNKIANRIFAFFFFVIIGLWVAWSSILEYFAYVESGVNLTFSYRDYIHPMNLAFLAVLIGLLYEIWRPTLNFEFDKNWKWKAAGIFLFLIAAIVITVEMFWQQRYAILGSRTFEFPLGSGNFHTWPNLLWGFLSTFCKETVSFSLLFGFLFMTKSTPQISKSYKIMLFGVAAFEVFVITQLYLPIIVAGGGMTAIYGGLTRMELLTSYWFHWNFWSELLILIGAIWLLKKGKEYISPILPWTPKEKRFVSIFVVLALFLNFVFTPFVAGIEPRKVFSSFVLFVLAMAGYILYLRKKRKLRHKANHFGK